MITLFGYTLTLLDCILLGFIVPCGLAFSLRNFWLRFISLFHGTYSQSELGKVIDWTWVTCIIVLIGLHY